MTVVGLYRNIYGIQPKHNRLYLEPHLTGELNGTQLRYNLRNQSYVMDLTKEGSRMAVDDFALLCAHPFALHVQGDTAEFFPGSQGTPALSVTRSRRAPVEVRIEAWLTGSTEGREWVESCAGRGMSLRHVVSDLQPHGVYRLLCDGQKVGSFEADAAGRIEFKRTLAHAKPERFRLVTQ